MSNYYYHYFSWVYLIRLFFILKHMDHIFFDRLDLESERKDTYLSLNQ